MTPFPSTSSRAIKKTICFSHLVSIKKIKLCPLLRYKLRFQKNFIKMESNSTKIQHVCSQLKDLNLNLDPCSRTTKNILGRQKQHMLNALLLCLIKKEKLLCILVRFFCLKYDSLSLLKDATKRKNRISRFEESQEEQKNILNIVCEDESYLLANQSHKIYTLDNKILRSCLRQIKLIRKHGRHLRQFAKETWIAFIQEKQRQAEQPSSSNNLNIDSTSSSEDSSSDDES